jgi:hypothetical protein
LFSYQGFRKLARKWYVFEDTLKEFFSQAEAKSQSKIKET